LYYEAATKRVRAFNGSGRAPAGLTLELGKTVAYVLPRSVCCGGA
jgi:hypothetical protein